MKPGVVINIQALDSGEVQMNGMRITEGGAQQAMSDPEKFMIIFRVLDSYFTAQARALAESQGPVIQMAKGPVMRA